MSQHPVLKDFFPIVPTAIDVPMRIDAIRLSIPRRSVDRQRLLRFMNNHPNFAVKFTKHATQIIIQGEFLYLLSDIAAFLRAFVVMLFLQGIFTVSAALYVLFASTLDADLLFTHVRITRLELTFDLRPDQIMITKDLVFFLAYRSLYSGDRTEYHPSTIIFYDLYRKYVEKGQTSKAFIATLTRPYRLEFRLYPNNPYLCLDNLQGSAVQIVQNFQFFLSATWHRLGLDQFLHFQNLDDDQETLGTMTNYVFTDGITHLTSKYQWLQSVMVRNRDMAQSLTQGLIALGFPQTNQLDDATLWMLFHSEWGQ